MLIAQTLLILSTKSVKNIFRVFVKYVNYQKCTLLWTFTGAVQMCRCQVMNPFRQYSCGSAWWRGGEECCYKINKVVPLSRRFISFRLDKKHLKPALSATFHKHNGWPFFFITNLTKLLLCSPHLHRYY